MKLTAKKEPTPPQRHVRFKITYDIEMPLGEIESYYNYHGSDDDEDFLFKGNTDEELVQYLCEISFASSENPIERIMAVLAEMNEPYCTTPDLEITLTEPK